MKPTPVGIILLGLCSPGLAQDRGTLTGRILDYSTQAPLVGANVVLDRTTRGAAAADDGSFQIEEIPAGQYTLTVTSIGYQTHRQEVQIEMEETLSIIIHLHQIALRGREVTVRGERVGDPRLEIKPPSFSLSRQELEALPGALEDPLLALQTLPGVVPVSDFSNQFVVRGGGPDQNLVLLDGVEIYNPYRHSGIPSLINPALVEKVHLYNSAFPALFGDRLSAVVAVETREADTDRPLGGQASASVSTASLVLEGKTGPWRGGWLVSGRRSYFDRFSSFFARRLGLANKVAFPRFEDLQGKLVLRPAAGQRLQLNALYNRNLIDYLVPPELGEQSNGRSIGRSSDRNPLSGADKMDNHLLGVSWYYTPSERLKVKVYAHWYRNRAVRRFTAELLPGDDRSVRPRFDIPPPPTFGELDTVAFDHHQRYVFSRYSLGAWTVYQGKRHILEAGIGVDYLSNQLDSRLELNAFGQLVFEALIDAPLWFGSLTDSLELVSDYRREHLYLQDTWSTLNGRLHLQPGLRYDHYGITGSGYSSPRLGISLDLDSLTTLELAWGIYRQSPGYEKLLDGGRQFDLLRFRSLSNLGAEKAVHTAVGLERQLGFWQVSIAGYRKNLEDLVVQDRELEPRLKARYVAGAPGRAAAYLVEEDTIFQATSQAANAGRVQAYGVEFRLKKSAYPGSHRWSGSISYAYGRSTQQQYLTGENWSFPFDYDRRQALTLAFSYHPGGGWTLGATWRLGTGLPYTPAVSVEPLVGLAYDPQDTTQLRGVILTDPETGYARFVPSFAGPENLNSQRLPDYHRLDIRLSYRTRWRRFPLEAYLDLINLYNRNNVLYYRNRIEIEGDEETLPLALRYPRPVLYREPVYMFPLIPSFGLRVTF